MKAETFFIDVLNLLPDDIELYMQAPDLENAVITERMEANEVEYYTCLHKQEKKELIKILNESPPDFDFIQHIAIKYNGADIFLGHDSLSSNVFSKTVLIPQWFKEKYAKDDDYMVAIDW